MNMAGELCSGGAYHSLCGALPDASRFPAAA